VLEKTTQDILKQLQQFRKQWSMFQKSFDTVAKKLKDTQEEFEKLSTTRARQLEVCLDRLEQRLPREKMESN
jgi:prefoldin subunit 5